MRGHIGWIAAAVGIVLVIVAGAAIGSEDNSGETVTAGEWAQSVCGAVGVWRGEMEAIIEDVRTPPADSSGAEEPQSETPQGRTGLVRKGVERAIQATETMVVAVDNAGVPDTEQGEESAEQISSWASDALNDLEQAEESLEEEAETLEEAVEQVSGVLETIGSVLVTGMDAVFDVASTDPEAGNAVRESSTCQELEREGGER
jgi:hypothetical protein